MPRPRIKVSSDAEGDIEEIADYTTRNWGSEQSRRYSAGLRAGFRQLREYPRLGTDRSDLEAGLRCLPVQEHRIFYQVQADLISVVRILHVREDEETAFA